jgi:hypothetical protein
MNDKISALLRSIKELDDAIEADLCKKRAEFRFTLEQRKIRFEEDVLRQHRLLKTGLIQHLRQISLRELVTAPIIYGMIFPFALVDFCVTVYQLACFPMYGLAKVRRNDYLIFDRSNLAYLNAFEKLDCFYCSYVNGLISYVKEIAALTEQYFCPIKHAQRILQAHLHYNEFVDFGDAQAFRRRLEAFRRDLEKSAER